MAINSPYRIGSDPSGKETSGKFYMTSEQGPRWGGFHDGYDLVGHPFVKCTCGKQDYECKCNAAKVDGNYKYPQKMIYSTTPGTVVNAGWENPSNHTQGYGLYVCIQSSIEGQTHYYHYFGHLCEISSDIKVGTVVDVGTFLGIEGSTGSSTGSHVHYGIRPNKKRPTSKSDPNFVSLSEFTGIPNVANCYYQDTRRAGTITPDYSGGLYIGSNLCTAFIFNEGRWKKVIPSIFHNNDWKTTHTTPTDLYVDIPQDGNLGTVISYMGYHLITAESSNQYKLKHHAMTNNRYKYSNPEYYATIDNRMLIATKPNIGNKLSLTIGDYVDVTFKTASGSVSTKKCIIGDFKGSDAPNPWGHYDGQGVVEIIYHDYSPPSGYMANKNNPWGSGRVTRITKVGSYGNYK